MNEWSLLKVLQSDAKDRDVGGNEHASRWNREWLLMAYLGYLLNPGLRDERLLGLTMPDRAS